MSAPEIHDDLAAAATEIATARKDMLRIATAGSVDDGKSTLIGRLLYDSKAVFEDQYESISRASRGDHVDLSLLTDGLRAERDVVDRGGMLYAVNEFITPKDGETVLRESVRYRTVGDANLTAAVRSTASTVEEVIAEIAVTRLTERGATRGDDKVSEAAMEDRKREGYF